MSEEFKQLAALLLAPEAGSRPTMADVLGHRWMRGEAASRDEFTERFGTIMQAAEADRKGEQDALDIDFQIASAGTRRQQGNRGAAGAGVLLDAAFEAGHAFAPAVAPRGQLSTEFSVRGKALELMGLLYDLAFTIDENVTLSKRHWRLTFTGVMQTPTDDEIGDEEVEGE